MIRGTKDNNNEYDPLVNGTVNWTIFAASDVCELYVHKIFQSFKEALLQIMLLSFYFSIDFYICIVIAFIVSLYS